MSNLEDHTARVSSRSTRPLELLLLSLLVLALVPSWLTFPATWSDGRSHGFAVAAYCLWLAYTRRNSWRTSQEWQLPGTIAVAVLGLGWLLSLVVGVRLFHQAAAIALLLAWAATVYGPAAFARLWPVAAIFSLALPFWEVLLGVLQGMTVAVNHSLVRLAGIPATLDGTRIHFPFGTIEVAQSCAGLSYFMSALTISVLYAHLFLRHTRARIVAVSLAVVLALVSNWIRVFGLVVIGYRSKMQSPLMEEHAFYGWVIFAVVISAFFVFTGRIERWERRSLMPDNVALPLVGEGDAPIESPAVTVQETRSAGVPRNNLLLGTSAALAAPLLYFAVVANASSSSMPATIPGVSLPPSWVVHTVAATSDTLQGPWLPNMRGEQHRLSYAVFDNDSAQTAQAEIVRFGYEGNSEGNELIGSGNAIAAGDRLVEDRVVGPLDNRLRTVRQAVVRTRTGARLVWYWYRVANVETPSPARAKLLELVAFFRRTSPSELIAVSAPCGRSDCKQAAMAVHQVVTGRPMPQDTLPRSQ